MEQKGNQNKELFIGLDELNSKYESIINAIWGLEVHSEEEVGEDVEEEEAKCVTKRAIEKKKEVDVLVAY
jgi:hypothetical protein